MCPYCGCATKEEDKKKQLNKVAVFVIAAIVSLGILFAIFQSSFIKTAFLDTNTKYAVKAAKLIQNDLLVPNSMSVLTAIVSTELDEEYFSRGNAVAAVYIYYSATNKGGGVTDSEETVVFYSDGKIKQTSESKLVSEYTSSGRISQSDAEFVAQNNMMVNIRRVCENGEEVDNKVVNEAIQ